MLRVRYRTASRCLISPGLFAADSTTERAWISVVQLRAVVCDIDGALFVIVCNSYLQIRSLLLSALYFQHSCLLSECLQAFFLFFLFALSVSVNSVEICCNGSRSSEGTDRLHLLSSL